MYYTAGAYTSTSINVIRTFSINSFGTNWALTPRKHPTPLPLNNLRIDGPEKMNTISGEFRQEIENIWLGQIADDPSVKAVVFISGKPDNYIAGADIRMISSTKDKSDLKKVGGAPIFCIPGLQMYCLCALF